MREISKLIIHCSATKPEMDIGADEIRDWHKGKGWDDIGYHFVIRRNGELEKGRDVAISGAHARGHNFSSIGICLIGGIDSDSKADDNFTLKQYNTLIQLVSFLKMTFPIDDVLGHRDLPNVNKECPCFDARAWLKFETAQG